MMKAFTIWWNEEQSKELTEEFLIKNRLVTQEQVIDLLAETVWRAALEWVSTFTISESIKRELEGR